MKKTRKLFALLLAVVMMMGLSVTASAANITIDNPVSGQTYTAYKLFDVSISTDGDSYSYSTMNKDLVSELKEIGLTFDESLDGNTFYVKANEDAFITESGTMTATELASELNKKDDLETLLGPGKDAEIDNGKTIIKDVTSGYYFVTSSVGALCVLNTVSDELTIHEKNSLPTIQKKVKEDSNKQWQESATIDVINNISYQLTVNTGKNGYATDETETGVNNDYIITDVLPEGITYTADSASVAGWDDTEYEVTYNNSERTLIITLSAEKLKELSQGTDIVITYNATAAGNLAVNAEKKNTVTLKYGTYTTAPAEAVIKTYNIGGTAEAATFTKVDGSDKTTPLEGVKFVLSKNTSTGIVYAKFDANNYLTEWVDAQSQATELETDEKGHIYAYGLDADTYILTETETLPGYNLLADTITVTINENGLVTYKYSSSSVDAGDKITIENETGTELPSTGGMGTTLIYIAGAVLVIGAGVLLVVRRRMNAER